MEEGLVEGSQRRKNLLVGSAPVVHPAVHLVDDEANQLLIVEDLLSGRPNYQVRPFISCRDTVYK